jgi:hypothetical protein
VRTAYNYFTGQYIAEDNSERHTRRFENLKCHVKYVVSKKSAIVSEGLGIES